MPQHSVDGKGNIRIMNTDQLAADFEQWIIKTFGVTWERSGIMHQFKTAIEKTYRQGLNEGFGKGKQAGIRDQISKAAHASEDLLHEATKMLANYSSYSEKERARFYAKVNRRAARASEK